MKKQISPLLEDMRFLFLRDFVNWLNNGIAIEWGKLEKRAENGEFEKYEDYEAAMDYPQFRAKYAAEAVLYLLNALVDEQLRNLVEAGTEYTLDPRKPALPAEEIARLSFREIQDHIEDMYKITLKDLEGWDDYIEIRNIVNSLKHSGGQRRIKEVLTEGGSWNDLHYKPKLEDAKKGLDICIHLVRTLLRIAHRNEQKT